ncbi:GGDEF domain-containing protein [Candidatus Gracilibacteria bacterium]|nr:GGDEF domain-containing protein [Candidatus Gracilibacteria bacterium]
MSKLSDDLEEKDMAEIADQKKKILALEQQLEKTQNRVQELLENTRWTADEHEDIVKVLTKKSENDPLTGLANREKMRYFLDDEIAKFERYGQSLSLIELDLDHFKKINDTHGHLAGDEVLKSISETIKKSIRKTDLAVRYGGEEFIIVLPNTSGEESKNFAERLRKNIEQNMVNFGNKTIKVTASLGVAELKKGETEKNLLCKADKALYSSKGNGRNQINYAE